MSYTKEELDTPVGKGTVYHRDHDRWLAGRLVHSEQGGWTAIESPDIHLSAITNGLRDETLKSLIEHQPKDLTLAIYISTMRRWLEGSDDPAERLEYEVQIYRMIGASHYDVTPEELDDGFFEKMVERAFSWLFRNHGASGAKAMARMIDVVEGRHRYRTEEENKFLKCIESVANEANRVPLQKEVHALWEYLNPDGNKNTFNGIKKRLGFSWLPAGTRGKRAVGRGFTSGK
jgi:hypothetical protein